MKISKIFWGGVALAVLSFGFASCSEDDDDPNEMIIGSNNNYSIAYTNDSGETSRGYKTTTFKHSGALCQITLNKDSTSGAMGYMWDLESNSSREAKDSRVFCIAGFNYNYTASGKVAYYVSRYRNITDILASNFGAKEVTSNFLTSTEPVEKTYLPLKESNSFTPTKDSDGNIVVTIDVYEDGDFTQDSTTGKRAYTSYNGGFCVDIYDGAVTLAETVSKTPEKSTKISASDLGYTVSDASKPVVSQRNGAVYANVYKYSTVNGSWKYASTYKDAEVVEE